MELVSRDGLLAEKSIQDLALWYADGKGDTATFEAHLLFLKTYFVLINPALRGRRTKLSLERYYVLRSLYRSSEKRMLMNEVSRELQVSPASVTKLVNALEKLNLVQRVDDAEDKRRTWVQITPEGDRLVRDSIPGIREATRARWQGLTEQEKQAFVHLLCKLILSVESADAPESLRLILQQAAAAAEIAEPAIATAGSFVGEDQATGAP